MPTTDTIVACASGMGRSPRAILRVFGPESRELMGRLCHPLPASGGRVGATRFSVTDGLELPCLVIRYDTPRSYTGEDGFELIVPGNPLLIDRLVRRIIATSSESGLSAREAEPGEFSARAYLNGKMALEEAEGVAAVIAAQTQDQLAAAGDLLAGKTGGRYEALTDDLATILALVEAGIDFTDQDDVVPIAPAQLASRLDSLCAAVRSELGSAAGAERLSALPRVVITGAPNAGKSTLFNALLGRRRSVESPVSGTTRDVILETIDLARDIPGGVEVQLIDVAGLDETPPAGEIAASAQAFARAEVQRADIVIYCDPSGRFSDPVATPGSRPLLRVRTKADLPEPEQIAPGTIGVCAIDGWHLGVLKRAIVDAAWGAGARDAGAAWLLPRHRRALTAALERLERARIDATEQTRLGARSLSRVELIAGDLRSGLDILGELVGKIGPDDIIGRVFATFCIGK